MDEGYITQQDFDEVCRISEDTTKLIGGFMAYLRKAEATGSKFKRFAGTEK